MRKRKIGILVFSDGRKFIHDMNAEVSRSFQAEIVKAMEATGEVDCVPGEIVWSPETARSEGKKLAAAGVEATVFAFAVWAFPHFPVIAAEFAPGPFLCLSRFNAKANGFNAMLAAAGALDQIGVFHARLTADVTDAAGLAEAMAFLRAASAVSRLKGKTYGLFGGRSMGMYTAVPALDQWRREFGLDIEHLDQWEIVRRAETIDAARVAAARAWLERHCAQVAYDGKALTPAILERQIRGYFAVRELIREWNLDFVGIKGTPELANAFCTMDLAEAFLNDPYDWEGPHEPIVCATEADSDAALTMELLKEIAGTPVLFSDIRHYDADGGFWDLVNSGNHATFFAGRSFDPLVNLPKVRLLPEIPFFPAGGAAIQHIAAPGAVTLGRLARRKGRYWMAIVPGEFLDLPPEVALAKAGATRAEWPHAFARLQVPPKRFVATYGSNHIHGVYGDYSEELQWVARILGMDAELYADR